MGSSILRSGTSVKDLTKKINLTQEHVQSGAPLQSSERQELIQAARKLVSTLEMPEEQAWRVMTTVSSPRTHHNET